MNWKKLLAAFVLIDFAALNAYALYAEGLGGFVELLAETDNAWALVLSVDLVIALGMVLVWMWSDARREGKKPIFYTVLTFLTGSIGPLAYLVTRGDEKPAAG